jgi:glucose-1-phosphate adenylyltransferase
VLLQTDADRRFLAAKGSVPIGIGKNSHIKRAIIDKNARIGDNVKVMILFITLARSFFVY